MKIQGALLQKIKTSKENNIIDLLRDLKWAPTVEKPRLSGNCVSGHLSESGTCAVVYPTSNSLYCFNCQKHFDSVSVVKEVKKLSFRDSVLFLANRCKNLSREEQDSLLNGSIEPTFCNLFNEAADYYHRQLVSDEFSCDLLSKRYSLNETTLGKYKIGLCSYNGNLKAHLETKGYSLDEMIASGLVTPNGKEFFDGRLVFPFFRNSDVVYFVGRKCHLSPPEYDNSGKYKKLPTSTGSLAEFISSYVDNSAVYGEDSILDSKEVIVAEGVTDCLSVLQLGLSSISPVTTGFSKHQKDRLVQLLNGRTVIVTGDNDPNKAGEVGAFKTCEFLYRIGIDVFYASIPAIDTSVRSRGKVPDVFKWPVGKTDLNDIIGALGKIGLDKVLENKKRYIEIKIDSKISSLRDISDYESIAKHISELYLWKKSHDLKTLKYVASLLSGNEKERTNIFRVLEKAYERLLESHMNEKLQQLFTDGLEAEVIINTTRPQRLLIEDVENKLSVEESFFYSSNVPLVISSDQMSPLVDSESLSTFFAKRIGECVVLSIVGDEFKKNYYPLPKGIANTIIRSSALFPSVKRIDYIYHHPFLNEDFSWGVSGYNEKNRIYSFAKEMEALEDVQYLKDILNLWPWSDQAGLANAIGVLLIGFIRHRYPGQFPSCLLSATGPGNGKGLFLNLYSTLFERNYSNVITYNKNEDELRKALVSLFLMGSNSVAIDNIREKEFSSALLESIITAPEIVLRILGGNTSLVRSNNVQFFFTLNDSMVSQDLIDRSIPLMLGRSGWEWEGRDFTSLFKANKEKIISILCGMIEKWIQAGCPRSNHSHRFKNCVSEVGGILEVNGIKGFLSNVELVRREKDSTMEEICQLTELMILNKKYRSSEILNLWQKIGGFYTEIAHCNERSKSIRVSKKLSSVLGKKLHTPLGVFVLDELHDSASNSKLYFLKRGEESSSDNRTSDLFYS